MLYLIKLISRNIFRHKLRSILTALGMVVAIFAFGLLRTMVDAWYAGADATSATRLITRNAISLVFDLPINYQNKIRYVEGVESVSYANWFGGVYINERNFFPQFAINADSYLDLYPEYILLPEQKSAFLHDRKGAMVGRKLAAKYGWRVGDSIPLRGTIYPGNWEFVLRGIYQGAEKKTDEMLFLFHWDYLNETLKKAKLSNENQVGVFVVGLKDGNRAAEISRKIDQIFVNSLAETLTETEKAFQLSFVSMTEAIVTVIKIVSLLIIVIIMAVMANTMAMTARERRREYATLKALGFGPLFIFYLILGESLMISLLAGCIGVICVYPTADYFATKVGSLFAVMNVSLKTVIMSMSAALMIGFVAAVVPAWRAVRTSITEGLSSIS